VGIVQIPVAVPIHVNVILRQVDTVIMLAVLRIHVNVTHKLVVIVIMQVARPILVNVIHSNQDIAQIIAVVIRTVVRNIVDVMIILTKLVHATLIILHSIVVCIVTVEQTHALCVHVIIVHQ
jgi:hypothetical protein